MRAPQKSKTGFARRRDKNEPAIVEALVAVGAVAQLLNGKGIPDLLVGYRLANGHGRGHPYVASRLLEVKAVGRTGGKRGLGLTDDQEEWWDAWPGEPPIVVHTREEALRAIGLWVPQRGLWTFCPLATQHRSCIGDDQCTGGRGGAAEECVAKNLHQFGTYPYWG